MSIQTDDFAPARRVVSAAPYQPIRRTRLRAAALASTTLRCAALRIASSHRIYAIGEKIAMGDGRQDSASILDATTRAAGRAIAFDMERASEESGAVISAVMLGALAIVIAVLIVLDAQDRKDRELPPPTVTNTITETTPYQSPAAMPDRTPDWTSSAVIGHGGDIFGAVRPDAVAASAHLRALPAPAQTWLRSKT